MTTEIASASCLTSILADWPDDRSLSVLEIGIIDASLSAMLDELAGPRVHRYLAIDAASPPPALAEDLDCRGHDLMRMNATDFAAISSEAFDLILAHAGHGIYPWMLRLAEGGVLVLEGGAVDDESQSVLRIAGPMIQSCTNLALAWNTDGLPSDSLAIRMLPTFEPGAMALLGTRLGIPLPAGDSAGLARVLGINSHSVFDAPAELERVAFRPPEAPAEWKLAVRSTLWHEDIDTRNRLIQTLISRDFGGDDDYQHLVENGWVRLNAPLGDIADIVRKADHLFATQAQKDDRYRGNNDERYRYVQNPILNLPELSRLLENQRINDLVRRYMGDDAIYSFGLLESMPAGVDVYDASGLWHHDKVGNRLKAFFLLCDVTLDGRPTLYASGSHLLDWPDYHYQGSRFSDAWTQRHLKTAPLTGKMGDVVLVDTNGLHRGNYEYKALGRQAFVAEYANLRKSWKLDCIGYFPDGIKPHRLPLGLNLDRTLVDRSELHLDGDAYAYGRQRLPGFFPNFN
ncbi:hypothetical protein CU669_17940 [Paramagnetospirillum kuznetsovii]|uniref:Phytanoyl-CoA dioxygenase n=1 Tax=Paramagnetospirillum kuznetsovii TaxID=2053833 RepID=A0A364NUD5_9PROT|nr:hypothetical protein [Paramagnetospirillum kuznetsovii]RAU20525.1 hypothetical protein CU669_17940 [Paramagnetospirillum kuznetsovii]